MQAYVYPTDEKYAEYMGEFNEKYPLPIIYKLPIMQGFDGEVKAKMVQAKKLCIRTHFSTFRVR